MLGYLQAVSVHKHLQYRHTACVNILDLLRGDVLALRQLEDVLLPIDDSQGAVLIKRAATERKERMVCQYYQPGYQTGTTRYLFNSQII